jgi:thiamine-monophosphate kinase
MALGEFELIRRYFSPAAGASPGAGVVLGVGDDAALLSMPSGCELVAAVDSIVAGRHFLPSASPHSIGYRSLAVNLSDLAAMGATPAWATLALTVPSAQEPWLAEFARGFLELAQRFSVSLVGGDTTAGPLTISVQLLGHVPSGTALRRDGARAGDWLAVTGTLGDAAAGLGLASERVTRLRAAQREEFGAGELELMRRFEYPQPRVEFGLAARGIATAAMDISDGLAGDLPKLIAASDCAARVEVERIPLSSALRGHLAQDAARRCALGGGDDYELLCTVPESRFADLQKKASALGLLLTSIGRIEAGSGVHWTCDGRAFGPDSAGFDHFR